MIKTLALIYLLLYTILPIESFAKGKQYGKKKEYTRNQQINNGNKDVPQYTTCRLMTMKSYKGGLACIYKGAQKTYEMEFTDTSVGCPRQYRCVYNPNSKEPSIDDIMKSLRDIAKKNK